jgi:hypothetical protein
MSALDDARAAYAKLAEEVKTIAAGMPSQRVDQLSAGARPDKTDPDELAFVKARRAKRAAALVVNDLQVAAKRAAKAAAKAAVQAAAEAARM